MICFIVVINDIGQGLI